MPEVTLTTLHGLKAKGEKITMLTCYDATFAKAASQAGVEVLLVGDSLGMVLQGHDSTLPVTTAEMAYHTASVKRGNDGALILTDLPFMAHATPEQAFANSATLMQAGAHMVKIEGAAWLAETIRLLAERGVPVCAHMGLTPQSVLRFGGFKVQGRGDAAAQGLRDDARAIADAEFGGRNFVGLHRGAIADEKHFLIADADDHLVAVVLADSGKSSRAAARQAACGGKRDDGNDDNCREVASGQLDHGSPALPAYIAAGIMG